MHLRALILSSLLVACAPEVPGPRSVLVISLDTARRDAFGFMGRSDSPSPNLDKLARESVVFEEAYTSAPLTLPAHASLLTGLYPASHGLRDNGAGRLPGAAETLAESLGRVGWRCRAAVSAFVLDPCFGLDQGFESFSAPPREPNAMEINVVQLRAEEMLERALLDLDELAAGEQPFFYWLHLYDPHAPYDAPGTTEASVRSGMRERELYDAEIRYADRQLGRLFERLKRLGLWDQLVVVFTSDHGEGLEDGHEATHGFFVFDETMRIPLTLKHPDFEARRFAHPVSIVDVTPTVLSSLGLVLEHERYDGIDLGPLLRGEPGTERLLLMESYQAYVGHGWSPFHAGVQGSMKYIRSRRHELFDRAKDSGERKNLWPVADEEARAIGARVDARFEELRGRLRSEHVRLGASDTQALNALGYVGAGGGLDAGEPIAFETLADAYEKYPLYERMLSVSQQIAAGDVDGALTELRVLCKLEPNNPALLEHLGEILVFRSRTEELNEAERCYSRVLELRPSRTQSRLGLANCALLRSETYRERMQEEMQAGREGPARALADQWRPLATRAVENFRLVLESEPNHPTALHNLSTLLSSISEDAYLRGKRSKAKSCLREARELTVRLIGELELSDPRRSGYEQTKRLLETRLRQLP